MEIKSDFERGKDMIGYGRKIRRKIENCKYTDEVVDLLARRIRQMPEYKHAI